MPWGWLAGTLKACPVQHQVEGKEFVRWNPLPPHHSVFEGKSMLGSCMLLVEKLRQGMAGNGCDFFPSDSLDCK